MKLTIITPALNAADTICDTIASVIDQTYNDIEYILVDRGSTDETVAIYRSMRHGMDINSSKQITGKFEDECQAIEKGVESATGEILAFLGAGDFFTSDDVVSQVVELFEKEQAQIVYGDLKFVDAVNTRKVTRRTCGRFYRRWPKTSGLTQLHPAMFITKELFLKSGGFRQGFPITADYEMMVRLLSERDHRRKYLHQDLVSVRQHAVNSTEAENFRKELVTAFDAAQTPMTATSSKEDKQAEHKTPRHSHPKDNKNNTVKDGHHKEANVKGAQSKEVNSKDSKTKNCHNRNSTNKKSHNRPKKTAGTKNESDKAGAAPTSKKTNSRKGTKRTARAKVEHPVEH